MNTEKDASNANTASFSVKANAVTADFRGRTFTGDTRRIGIESEHDQTFTFGYGKRLSDGSHSLEVADGDISYLDAVGQTYDVGVSGRIVVTVSGGATVFKGVLTGVTIKDGNGSTAVIDGTYTYHP